MLNPTRSVHGQRFQYATASQIRTLSSTSRPCRSVPGSKKPVAQEARELASLAVLEQGLCKRDADVPFCKSVTYLYAKVMSYWETSGQYLRLLYLRPRHCVLLKKAQAKKVKKFCMCSIEENW